jgi:hypothetical protein
MIRGQPGVLRTVATRFNADRVPPLYCRGLAGRPVRGFAPTPRRKPCAHPPLGCGFHVGTAARVEPIRRAATERVAGADRVVRARYLVVPTSLYGKFFPLDRLGSDPAYTFEMGYQGRDVAVIRVSPNRSGTITVGASPSVAAIDACDTVAAARSPGGPTFRYAARSCCRARGRRRGHREASWGNRARGRRREGGGGARADVLRERAQRRSRASLSPGLGASGSRAAPPNDRAGPSVGRGAGRRQQPRASSSRTLPHAARPRSHGRRSGGRMRTDCSVDAMAFAPDDPVVLVGCRRLDEPRGAIRHGDGVLPPGGQTRRRSGRRPRAPRSMPRSNRGGGGRCFAPGDRRGSGILGG